MFVCRRFGMRYLEFFCEYGQLKTCVQGIDFYIWGFEQYNYIYMDQAILYDG